jgi:prophage antirepressor-like protein
MNELTYFNHHIYGDLPVMIVNGMEWFGASEAADALCFSNSRAAINNHVEEDDVTVHDIIDGLGRKQGKKFINESGLYSLIFGAAKQGNNQIIQDKAKSFKRWVTSEVLPSIRKTGQYVKPLSEREQLVAAMKLSIETSEEIAVVKEEVKEVRGMVENQITLDHGEQRRIQRAVGHRIYELESDPETRAKLFREIYREIKDRFAVASYRDIKRKDILSVVNYIAAWVPRRVS